MSRSFRVAIRGRCCNFSKDLVVRASLEYPSAIDRLPNNLVLLGIMAVVGDS